MKSLQPQYKPLTPELAREFATMAPLPGERELRPARVKFLQKLIHDKHFVGAQWAQATDRSTGKIYRANGQHSSFVLSQLDEEHFPKGLYVTVQPYEIDSMDEAVALFELFDNPASGRSVEDVMGVVVAPFKDLEGISRAFLCHAARGISAYEKNAYAEAMTVWSRVVRKNPDAPEPPAPKDFGSRELGQYYQTETNRKLVRWLHNLSGESVGVPRKNEFIFDLPGVVAVMVKLWEKNETFATVFFRNVLEESHPDPTDFSRELATQLRDWKQQEKRRTQLEYLKLTYKFAVRAASLFEFEQSHPAPAAAVPAEQ